MLRIIFFSSLGFHLGQNCNCDFEAVKVKLKKKKKVKQSVKERGNMFGGGVWWWGALYPLISRCLTLFSLLIVSDFDCNWSNYMCASVA